MAAFALTIFTGAFLLFQVQPLIGKFILPWFGGGPGVWTTCMLFFQMLLVGGYAYAHFSSRRLKPRTQALVHLILLAIALAWLPIIPSDSWKPVDSVHPTLRILALLAANLGLPYFVLSATGPLIQSWFCQAAPTRSPYRLYALSNAGSLLALLSYPFFFETHFTRKAQAGLWGWCLAAYAIFCAWCALRIWKLNGAHPSTAKPFATQSEPPPTGNYVLWLLLPACASVLLLAVTNKLCLDVAVIPFLWVLPLALYLLSFVICFDSPRWYARFPFTLGLVASSAGVCWALFQGTDLSLLKQIVLYSTGLFVCCMVCHGELYRLRPDPSRLTGFYLAVAVGGALGGFFVAVLAPQIFHDFYELHAGLCACGLLFLFVCAWRDSPTAWCPLACVLTVIGFAGFDRFLADFGHDPGASPAWSIVCRICLWLALVTLTVSWWKAGKFKAFTGWRGVACTWLGLGWVALVITLWFQGEKTGTEAVYRTRNFYGVLTIYEHERDDPQSHYFLLEHGRITHGLQFVDPVKARWPTAYYGEESGIGLAIQSLPPGPRRLGLVGLGTGTLSAYGRPGDSLRIYEINPAVQRLATSSFAYLRNCPSQVGIVLGDARLSLERESPQHFDLLALDAFSSDAIPVHLLTREAFQLYQRHLNTNAVIAVHISNHFLNLEPVVANLAREFHYQIKAIDYDETDEQWWLYPSTWLLLTRDNTMLSSPTIREASYDVKTNTIVPLWTDDFASLYQILSRD